MKIFVFLIICANLVFMEDIKDLTVQELLKIGSKLFEMRYGDVKKNDVSFYLYSKQIANKQIFDDTMLDDKKKTKFLIHGFLDNHKRKYYKKTTEEFLKAGDFNVVQVDWGRVAQSFYYSAVYNVKLIGNYVGNFILNQNISLETVHIIGHSLGAHIASVAAQTITNATKQKIYRITALDPAGPGYLYKKTNKLSKSDANIVDVIHTDGGVFGLLPAVGSFDIFVGEGSRIQPRCRVPLINITTIAELFEASYCSHASSHEYFAELINNRKFSCHQCNSKSDYFLGRCKRNTRYTFGVEDINEEMKGVCFVHIYDK